MPATVTVTVVTPALNSGLPCSMNYSHESTLAEVFQSTEGNTGQPQANYAPVVNGNSANWSDRVTAGSRVQFALTAQKNG